MLSKNLQKAMESTFEHHTDGRGRPLKPLPSIGRLVSIGNIFRKPKEERTTEERLLLIILYAKSEKNG